MRQVKLARHEGERNLLAVQYERNIYYKTVSVEMRKCEEPVV